MRLERLVVLVDLDRPTVDAVLARASRVDDALVAPFATFAIDVDGRHARLLRPGLAALAPVLRLISARRLIHVHRIAIRSGRSGSARVGVVGLQTTGTVDQVAQLGRPELRRPHAEHERDGVEEVGLAGPIGADHAGERLERAEDLVCQSMRGHGRRRTWCPL